MWKGATKLQILFNISLNQFQTAPCQIFPSLVPVKLPASQFLFQGNYDDGKENIFHLPRNHNMTIRFLAERVAIVIKSLQLLKRGARSKRKSTPLIAYVTITWGAAARTAKVAIMVKRVNVIRQSRSSTIAANFQSFSVAADSSSSLSITIIIIIVVVNIIIIIIISHWLILDLILSVIILISLSIKLSSRWIPGGNIEPGGSSGAGSVLGSLRKKFFNCLFLLVPSNQQIFGGTTQ